MFSTTSSSTCTFWYLCMESFTYLCLFTTVVSYPISSPEKATLDKAFDKAIADAVPCSNSWQKLLISRWYILGGSKERKKILVGHWRSPGCLLSPINHLLSYYLSVFFSFCLKIKVAFNPNGIVYIVIFAYNPPKNEYLRHFSNFATKCVTIDPYPK